MDRWEAAVYVVAAIFVIFIISYAESLRGSNPIDISIAVTQPTIMLSQTMTVTTTHTLNTTSSLSGEKALYGRVTDFYYGVDEGGRYTAMWLIDSEGYCCGVYVFDGFVQGVPYGAKVMIVYREYFEGFQRHLVISEIREIV